MRHSLVTRFLFLAAAFASFGVAGATGPIGAHEGDGRLEVLTAEPREGGTVAYRVRSVFIADGHPAPEATVTATVVDPADPQVPQTLTKDAEDGVYEGVVRFPRAGTWTVRFTSLRPTATLERTEDIAPPSTSAPAPDPTASTSPAPLDDEPPHSPPSAPSGAGSDSSGPIVALVAVVAIGVLAGALWRRRRRTSA